MVVKPARLLCYVFVSGMYLSIGHVKFPKFETGILVEWKAPEMSNFYSPLTYDLCPGNGPSLDPSKINFLSFV